MFAPVKALFGWVLADETRFLCCLTMMVDDGNGIHKRQLGLETKIENCIAGLSLMVSFYVYRMP